MLEWNGENGRTYFYQSEYPYDVDTDYASAGFASYKVGENVSTHEAWGVGVYSFFRDHTVDMDSGIKAPSNEGVKFHNSLSVFLNGNGSIKHVINGDGDTVPTPDHGMTSFVCEWPQAGEELNQEEEFLKITQ